MDNKSQAAPFLVAVLIVILLMAFVTINIGRVGIFRADISNAVDAGALAGGSSMAYYLNEQCYLNGIAIDNYKNFVILVDQYINGNSDGNYGGNGNWGGNYGGNFVFNGSAIGPGVGILPNLCLAKESCASSNEACETNSGCVYYAQEALRILTELAGGNLASDAPDPPPASPPPDPPSERYVPGNTPKVIPDYQWRQWYLYSEMKEKALEGREYSISLALRFAFLNSGIGKEIPAGNAALPFKDFLFSLKDPGNIPEGNALDASYERSFSWRLPSEDYYASVTAETDPVTEYELWVAKQNRTFINQKLRLVKWIIDDISDVADFKMYCGCCRDHAGRIQTKIDEADEILNTEILDDYLKKLKTGNQDGNVWTDGNFGDELVGYVNDMPNQSWDFTVYSDQKHGKDQTRWIIPTKYPMIEAKAVATFEGKGEICGNCDGNFEGNDAPIGQYKAILREVK